MFLSLSPALSIKTRYIEKRGNVYQFVMRVPAEIIPKFGKNRIRESLKTSDFKEAIRKAEALAKQYLLQFKTLRENPQLTPVDVSKAATELAQGFESLDEFIEFVLDPKLEKHADPDEESFHSGDAQTYHDVDPSEYLTPVELRAAQILREGKDAIRLSNALDIYWNTHKKSGDVAFRPK